MERQTIERALASLDHLLEEDFSDEKPYQDWFESNPIVLQTLGFGRAIPHPIIEDSAGNKWVPDFLVQAPNGTWEVFELKTPQAAILKDVARRQQFYAAFDSYVMQCREYARAFDDPRTREAFEKRYDITLHKDLRSTIVAGRSTGLDARTVHELAIATFPPKSVLTYDDVRARLEQYRTFNFGKYENAVGLGLIFVLVLGHPPTATFNNHIFDVGGHQDRDRVSAFVNPQGYLRLNVRDSNGVLHSARSALPLEEIDYGTPHVVTFSVGVGDGFGFLSIEVDRKYRADIRIEDFPFAVTDHYVLGSDITGTASSWICFASLIVTSGPPSFDAKAKVQEWADRYHIQPLLANPAEPWAVFRGRQSLRSTTHPFPSAESSPPTFGPCPYVI